jgi:phospholipid transport system substrate-binding protein
MIGIVRNVIALALSGALLLAVAQSHADVAGPAPDVLVRDTSQKVLDALNGKRDELRDHPEQVRQIVDQYLLPVFDVEYAGRVVLGQAGKDATPEQRKRFIDAFYASLVRTYGTGLLKFTSDTMKVLPYKPEPGAERTRVRTEVALDDGSKAAVDYSLHVTDKGWMLYDVTIEGISYLTNYRKMVASEVGQKGLDGLIAALEQGTVPVAIKDGDTKGNDS